MQSLPPNTSGPSPYQPPIPQTVVPSILVQPPSDTHGTPSFPVPQPLTAMQPMATSGTNAQGSAAPPFPVPQRHGTTPTQPTSPVPSHPLRAVRSAPGQCSRPSLLHIDPTTGSNGKPRVATIVETLREALNHPEGEIPVLEKYDRSWATVLHSGPLATQKSDSGPWWDVFGSGISWTDASGALLDNHFLLLGKETSLTGTTKSSHIIRPIPLDCLRLAAFNDEPEVRKEEQGLARRIMSCFSSLPAEPMYPFTIYHSAAKITRRHTLYTQTATERNRWHTALDDAITARKSQQDVKMLYAPQTLNDGFFRIRPRIQFNREAQYTGRAVCAAGFSFQGEGFIAVGCTSGIYVSKRATEYSFRRVLEFNEPASIVAIPEFNKFLILCEFALYSCPLDMVVRVSQGNAPSKDLDNSVEGLAEEHGAVSFFKTGRIVGRTLVIYAGNVLKQAKLHVLELIRRVGNLQTPAEYELLSSMPIPEDPHDAVFFQDKVAICASKAMYIVEPLNTTNPSFKVVPDLPNSKRDAKTLKIVPEGKGDAPRIFNLMNKVNILGMVTYQDDILLIYEDLGCFVNDVGKPARSIYYIEWERRASTYARRGPHLLLLSPGYVEVRSIDTGKLVQIVEAIEMRLLRSGLTEPGMLVAAMSGGTEDDGGRTEKLVELVYHGN